MHEHPAGLLDRVLHVRDVRGAMPLVEVRRVVPGKECCETAHLLILPKDGWWSSVVVGGRHWSSMGWRPPSPQRATRRTPRSSDAGIRPVRAATGAASERRMSFTGLT